MRIEIYYLRSYAPSCLNRDDSNLPKTCSYGNIIRGRVSSQCLKRVIRDNLKNTSLDLADRSTKHAEILKNIFISKGKDPEESKKISLNLKIFTSSSKKKKSEKIEKSEKSEKDGNVMMFFGKTELCAFADYCLDNWEDIKNNNCIIDDSDTNKKQITTILRKERLSPDIAMFGRLLASIPELRVDGSVQVTHALTTHQCSTEIDFFTAVDDLKRNDETGSGMLGETYFNSGTFYHYINIDVNQLMENLGGDVDITISSIRELLTSIIDSVPTAKQTSFAAYNPLNFMGMMIKEKGQPLNVSTAFEEAITANSENGGYVKTSIRKLDEYFGKSKTAYDIKPIFLGHTTLDDDSVQNFGNKYDSFYDMASDCVNTVTSILKHDTPATNQQI